MNSKEQMVLLKNAVANVARGSAAAFVAILLPPFLTRLMSPDAYSAWALVLQVSAFVGYLDFGIQTAVGRFIAHSGQSGDTKQRDLISSTSFAMLGLAGAFGLIGSVAIAFLLPHIFHQVPQILLHDSRWAIVLVGGTLAIGLPFSLFNAVFVGLQRYEVPAAVIGGSRLLGALFLILIVRHGGNLIQMGVAVAVVNLVSYALQYVLYRKLAPRVGLSLQLISLKTGRELFDYCLSLGIWSFGMLLVSGLDVTFVGYFEFEKVAYYSVATTLIVFLAGFQNALFSAMIPASAVTQARGNSIDLGQTMITATRYGSFVLLLMGLPLIFAAKNILAIWVGPRYAAEGARILQVLTAANMIRLSAVPYVMTLIGTGQQRLVTITPLLEGGANLIISLVAGFFVGAIGVAIGTLIGGIIGILGNFLYNMPRTVEISFRFRDYLRDGFLRPLVCALPLTTTVLVFRVSDSYLGLTGYLLIGIVLTGTVLLFWRWGLVGPERMRLRSWYGLFVQA
jgi:O-antigen/teichoic acid export membrane protein